MSAVPPLSSKDAHSRLLTAMRCFNEPHATVTKRWFRGPPPLQNGSLPACSTAVPDSNVGLAVQRHSRKAIYASRIITHRWLIRQVGNFLGSCPTVDLTARQELL